MPQDSGRATVWLVAVLALAAIALLLVLGVGDPEPTRVVVGSRSPEAAIVAPEVERPALLVAESDELEPGGPSSLPLAAAGAFSPVLIGRVLTLRGTPAAEVRVTLEVPTFELRDTAQPHGGTVTASDGTFRLCEATRESQAALFLFPPDGPPQFVDRIPLVPGSTIDLGDISLLGAQPVLGFIRDEHGRPLAGAEVMVTDKNSFVSELLSVADIEQMMLLPSDVVPEEDWIQSLVRSLPQPVRGLSAADGSFRLDVVCRGRDDVVVVARAPGHTLAWSSTDPWPAAPGAGELTLLAAPAHLAGRVVTSDGREPGEAVLVWARAEGTNKTAFGRSMRTRTDGSFSFEGLLDAPHKLEAFGAVHGDSEPLTVAPGTLDVRVVLDPRLPITVRAKHEDKPVLDFELVVVRHQLGFRSTTERLRPDPPAKGSISLVRSEMRLPEVQAFARDLCSRPVTLKDVDSKRPDGVWLELGPARMLTGLVFDRSGQPVAGARVWARIKSLPRLQRALTATDADGCFELGPLPAIPSVSQPGATTQRDIHDGAVVGEVNTEWCTLIVDAPGFVTRSHPVSAEAAEPVQVTLDRSTLVHVRLGPVLEEAARAGLMNFLDDVHDVRFVEIGGNSTWEAAVGPVGLLLTDIDPGRYRLELLRTAAPVTREFELVSGKTVVVDF